jgi:hypothetical protein
VTWFRVDDNLAFHPKVMQAGNTAMGLWVRAGSWSSQQLTDGYIPAEIVRSMGNTSQAAGLIRAGLWIPASDGYEFHQWEERQPTRKAVEDQRAATAERVRKHREKRRNEHDE